MGDGKRNATGRSFGAGAVAALAAAAALVPAAMAGGTVIGGAFGFDPIDGSAVVGSVPETAPFKVPAGFTQTVIWDEKGLYSGGPDFYPGPADVPDMIQSNETGKDRGRYLYRTHEVRAAQDRDGDGTPEGPYGALSVTDLKTGTTRLLAQRADWEALDGLRWTPWGTLLFAEETVNSAFADPDFPDAESGLLYEISFDVDDPSTAASIHARPAVGALAHEGIGVDGRGDVYVVDEFASGCIYRFVPDVRGDLSSGRLYVLEVEGFDRDDYVPGNGDASIDDRTGPARWVALDRDQARVSARVDAALKNGTPYGRPEDVEIIDRTLYVACTSEDLVLAVDLNASGPYVSIFVKSGRNVPVESGGSTGLNNPDNLAADHAGNLYIIEDNSPGDIWCATPDRNGDGLADRVVLFASLGIPGAEPTGMYFGKDPRTAYVHVQHSSSREDMMVAVTKE